MKPPIYMDHHATTPVDPRVLEAMRHYFSQECGNAASRQHAFGHRALAAVDEAREKIAALLGAAGPQEIIFTSGATESDNLAVLGAAEMYAGKGRQIITARTEHKAVLDSCANLERAGRAKVTYLDVDSHGLVDPAAVRAAITPKTILVTIMAANNEIGTIAPTSEIGAVCREAGVFFHCDATQAAGKIPLDVEEMKIDLASISAHKMYGPKGVGALYVRRRAPRVRLAPIIHGGGHERGMRSGTLNVPGIVGFARAFEISVAEMRPEQERVGALRDRLHRGITERLEEVYLNGHPTERLAMNLNLSFAGVEGEAIMLGMPEVAVSSGSACTSASLEPSHVLRAIGVREDLAHTSIRFGLGRFNTAEEVEYVVGRVVEEVRRLREMSPLWEMVQKGIDLTKVEWHDPH